MWKAVETKVREIRIGKAKEKRTKRGGREEAREGKEEANKRKQNDRYEKGSRRVGNLG